MKVVECFYDVETTGLEINEGAVVVQFACQIVEDGTVMHEMNAFINPYSYNGGVTINPKALEINGIDKEDLEGFEDLELVVNKLMHLLTVNYPTTKLTLVGYNNSTFDKYFLEAMFKNVGKSYSTYFNWKQIDIFETTKYLQHIGFMGRTYNQKLQTIATYLKVILRS
jgi:DNA polymerase III alpha subunit (gram-positive type)